ncbi:putative 39S ribosomal protein L45-like protein [Dinothrombium tinctorium]|uniref:Large ribosomal subunit protein mL45 n=1 Tax=Dinothrombium tinctorium TaxID=1965070 RepID=A0A443RQ01_9ACAR|nr:putative 39S ribosomal protein L45-like protein [Dinothrombium tinctorium]
MLTASVSLSKQLLKRAPLLSSIHGVEKMVERWANTKPYNPGPLYLWKKGIRSFEYRRLRGRKIAKVELPDFNEARLDYKLTPDEIRAKLKEKGLVPPRQWRERPLLIMSTQHIADSYVPPEGDGKATFLSKDGAVQSMQKLTKKGKSFMSLRKIRSFLYDFDVPAFADEALDIYIKAHQAIADEDEDKLHEYVTEKCFPEMLFHCDNKTIRWNFIKSLEPPRVVHLRHEEIIEKTNIFAQVTVRLHTQQILAVYDRFGRLMHGSENVVKDVLEYVVFENNISSEYGKWRIHGKIIPEWMPSREPILKTYRKPVTPEEDVKTESTTKSAQASDEAKERRSSSSSIGGTSGIVRNNNAWFQRKIHLRPVLRGCHLITDEVLKQLTEITEFSVGLCHIQILHTSASLALNENWDPDVREDMEMFLSRLVPESTPFRHSCEGPDDMPAHIKACFLGSSLTIPITDGKLNLGTWQGIWLCEHRNRAGSRKVVVTINGALKNGA